MHKPLVLSVLLVVPFLGPGGLGGGLSPATATTFVEVSDGALVDGSAVIAIVRVLDRRPAPLTSGLPHTDYRVAVDRLLKGDPAGSTLVVRVPGGTRPDGVAARIHGVPRFEPGEQALLFLDPAEDGSWHIRSWTLGAFHLVDPLRGAPDARLAVRDLTGALQVPPPGTAGEEAQPRRGPRSLEAFVSWITDRVRGEHRPPDYFLPESRASKEVAGDAGDLRSASQPFTLLTRGEDQRRIRWFEFDDGLVVVWRAHRPQPGLSGRQRQRALDRGFEVWNAVGGANVHLVFAGETDATRGFDGPDGRNTLLFDDPENTFDAPPVDCNGEEGGGPLAAALSWSGPEERGYRGRPHRVIREADVLFNRGLECYFDLLPDRQATAGAIVGHELGHTLGLGHSSQRDPEPNALLRDALMYFRARGLLGQHARTNRDDRDGLRALYGTGPPAAPTDLVGEEVSDTELLLTWTDNADDESSFRVEQAVDDGPFAQVIGFLPRNSEAVTVGDLVAGTRYRFRVRAHNELGFSDYSAELDLVLGVPSPPSALRVAAVTDTRVELAWEHGRPEDTSFQIEVRSPTGPSDPVVFAPGALEGALTGLDPTTPYTFRISALRNGRVSDSGPEVSVTTGGDEESLCIPGERNLCLLDGRFRVRVDWRDPRSGDHGVGRVLPVPGSDVSGLFWFFDAANVELIVKMLDGVPINGSFWTFYGGLSDVEIWIGVTDTSTGDHVTYHNPPGEICGRADVGSFPQAEVEGARVGTQVGTQGGGAVETWPRSPASPVAALAAPGASGTCAPEPETLCLLDGRFQVEVEWDNPRQAEDRGTGVVAPVTSVASDRTGFFWFFSPSNLELVVKVLDARPVNGHFWFFYGALSDVGYRITVTDTVAGISRVYENDAFNLCGRADVRAF